MFRLYSKGCEYAVRALVHVPPAAEQERFRAKDVCQKAGIPEAYTRKIFQALSNGGFLEAARGPGGGYKLTDDPKNISLLSIIFAIDGPTTFGNCIMGLPKCDEQKPCPLHYQWATAKAELMARLESQTLYDLAQTVKSREGWTLEEVAAEI